MSSFSSKPFCFHRIFAAAGLIAAALAFTAHATPLDDYVATPDPAFTYGDGPVQTTEADGYTAHVYKMVSQEWLDASLVDRTKWEHWVVVFVPKELAHSKSLVFIGGGSNRGEDPPSADSALAQVAMMTKSVVVEVKQIPNQPLKFTGEQDERYKEEGRSEDALITYGWDKFLEGGDPIWLARLPMTKAVVRAMDMVQAERPEIEGFVVAGGSKRGWTTWTVAAVDKRVIGIVPAVIDVLNVANSLDFHFDAYGFWAPAVGDYVDMNILPRRHTPRFKELEAIVDPYSYIDRLTMPKFVLNSAGDQFFPPNSWEVYYNDLKGETHLRYVPNTDHGLNLEAYFNLASFYQAVALGTPLPKYTWKKEANGALEVRCETKPTKVLLWKATNPEGRDFRLEKIGQVWESSEVNGDGNGVYRAELEAPEKGWTAFLLEMQFPNPDFSSPFVFSTGVSVVPDTFPFKDTPEPESGHGYPEGEEQPE
ncbi:MAG: hypothetical protein AMXMBFR82_46130 [Candidatus Hydrogenedentota bacterium]